MKLVTAILTISALFFVGSEAAKKDKECRRNRKCRKDPSPTWFGEADSTSDESSSSSSRDILRVFPAVKPLDTGMNKGEIKTVEGLKKFFLDEINKSFGLKFDFLVRDLPALTEPTDLEAKVVEFGQSCQEALDRRVDTLKNLMHRVYCSKKEARKLKDRDHAKESFRRELTATTTAA